MSFESTINPGDLWKFSEVADNLCVKLSATCVGFCMMVRKNPL